MRKTYQKNIIKPDQLSVPKRNKETILRLVSLFIGALKNREKVLPKAVLHRHLNSILEKSEILLNSASRFGTPQYFFDEPSLSLQIIRFNSAFSKHFNRYRAFYAMKSNSFAGICRHVTTAGMGIDVSSGLELSRALTMDCKGIIFSGPGKTDEELMLAIQNRKRVTLLMDSMGEMQRLSKLLKRENHPEDSLKVGIRLRSNHGEGWNKFGIPLKDLADMLRKSMTVKGLDLSGIQFHTSWNLDPTAQISMINEIGSYIQRNVPAMLWQSFKFLDIGGGFWPEEGEWLNPQNTLKGQLVRLLDPEVRFRARHYYRKSRQLDHFAREIATAISLQGPPLSDLEIWTEPGRWISTSAMHILLTVIDKKDSRTVITDGGINLLGWERPLTEFVPVINLTKPALKEVSLKIFGSLCAPYDIWGTSVFGNGVDTGDVLVIPDQGAYTYSLRQSFIKPLPKVIRYDGNSFEEVDPEITKQ
jgi:diaminopimelate decarboxylase